mmetsp:Transcript_15575/g.36722  ORF Transcript_15575/g.36722 Transcript_15575/m.36722 type:complete len:335 (+) Transcript_15575:721-1725(+)
MLVAEIVTYHLHVIILLQLFPRVHDGRRVAAQILEVDSACALPVIDVENAAGDSVGIPVLELLGVEKKVQARVGHQNGMQKDVEVLLFYPVVVVLLHHREEAEGRIVRQNLPVRPANHHHLCDGHRSWDHHGISLRDGTAVDDVIKRLHLVKDGGSEVFRQLEHFGHYRLALLPVLDAIFDTLLHEDLVDLVFVLLAQLGDLIPFRPPEARDSLRTRRHHRILNACWPTPRADGMFRRRRQQLRLLRRWRRWRGTHRRAVPRRGRLYVRRFILAFSAEAHVRPMGRPRRGRPPSHRRSPEVQLMRTGTHRRNLRTRIFGSMDNLPKDLHRVGLH